MSVELESIKQRIATLPAPEKAQLAAFLTKQLQHPEPPPLSEGADCDDEIRRRRLTWIKSHREEYAGQYVALDDDALVGAGRTIREAHQQAKAAGVERPFLARITSERETLSAGW